MGVIQMYSDSAKRATYKYREKNIKRIPLDVQKDFYIELKEAADSVGEKVNEFIKRAIEERIDSLPKK